jgi:dienelactone hydrolase
MIAASMRTRIIAAKTALAWLASTACPSAAAPAVLPGTAPLTLDGDLSARMVAGIDHFLTRETDRSLATRSALWQRDGSSPAAYEKSVAPNRERFRKAIGAVDARLPVEVLEFLDSTEETSLVASNESYFVRAVRWRVFDGVFGEGLLLVPTRPPVAAVVALPDADQTPEMLAGLADGLPAETQFARRLAENGCLVLVPTLIDRQDTGSGNPRLNRFTNQPHREWIYRQAYELGRHIIGYEVQKVLAAVDWLDRQATATNRAWRVPPGKIGVAGYGEGALIAFYSSALDARIAVTLVSGYFDSRQGVWREPIYRNVFGLLREFGDAEIASLVAPRSLIIEHSRAPRIDGPPPPRAGRSGAAPGQWTTPEFNSVDAEVERANEFIKALGRPVRLVHANEGMPVGPGSERALSVFLRAFGLNQPLRPPGPRLGDARHRFDPAQRQRRQVEELVQHTQRLMQGSERVREGAFWPPVKRGSLEEYRASVAPFKAGLWNTVIGRLPSANVPAQPRSRRIQDPAQWTSYDVVLDVWPGVFAWGVLLLPKDLQPGERRPVVVCQHGLEGVPADTIIDDPKAGGYGAYRAFAARLAEHGFVVFAPHNPYRGGDAFRVLQRKANPLGASLFSVILAQHERILDWLSEQPFVDPARIGFYGLSYGGKTAMRVPALLERYALSICSADFNEWVKKNVTVESTYSYMFTGEYEMPEFDLGHTFNYAEMAALIAPRPFMVERGHDDGVAPDEWVAYEYAKVRRHYDKLGVGDRTEIEFFNGPHTIHGVGTFQFLHRHLKWPERK